MPPEKKWKSRKMVDAAGGGGGEVRARWHRPAFIQSLYRSARQVFSAPPPPPHPTPPSHLKSVFSLISMIWENQPDSHPQSADWACLLPQAPRLVFALIFDFRQTKFIAFLGLAPHFGVVYFPVDWEPCDMKFLSISFPVVRLPDPS